MSYCPYFVAINPSEGFTLKPHMQMLNDRKLASRICPLEMTRIAQLESLKMLFIFIY